ncbi:deoxyribonuclease IV [Candidatus Dependentiae bacterium]|nr:deoxyribonuclease IV [Candidatus Dependentiae bacterium]
MKKDILIGSHLSIAGGFWQALVRAHSIGATCVQIFTKSNRQWAAKKITDDDIKKFLSIKRELNIKTIIAHASYLINLASSKKDVQEKSIKALVDEIDRCEKLEIPYLVLHPGSNSLEATSDACTLIADNLNKVISLSNPKRTMILLETMAGQGSTIGKKFEDLAKIIGLIKNKKHIGICVDTCHIFAAGYKFDTEISYQALWKNFDEIIGIKRIKVIHMNDSKKELGCHIDRHEHIAKGKILPLAFKLIMNDKKFAKIAKILETPNSSQNPKQDQKNLDTLKSYIKK